MLSFLSYYFFLSHFSFYSIDIFSFHFIYIFIYLPYLKSSKEIEAEKIHFYNNKLKETVQIFIYRLIILISSRYSYIQYNSYEDMISSLSLFLLSTSPSVRKVNHLHNIFFFFILYLLIFCYFILLTRMNA